MRRCWPRAAWPSRIVTQGNFVGSLIGLCIATIGIASATPLFFTITSEYLSKAAAAGGIALISSLGNLGAAVSPSITGAINTATGNPNNSMYLVIACISRPVRSCCGW